MEAFLKWTKTFAAYQEALRHSVSAHIHMALKEKHTAARALQFAVPSSPFILALLLLMRNLISRGNNRYATYHKFQEWAITLRDSPPPRRGFGELKPAARAIAGARSSPTLREYDSYFALRGSPWTGALFRILGLYDICWIQYYTESMPVHECDYL